ncbi:MAG TPA: hypothetical protein ACN46L_06800 [Prochlorococcus sp.]
MPSHKGFSAAVLVGALKSIDLPGRSQSANGNATLPQTLCIKKGIRAGFPQFQEWFSGFLRP